MRQKSQRKEKQPTAAQLANRATAPSEKQNTLPNASPNVSR